MQNDCVQLEFMGFDPEQELRNFVASVAEKLHLSAPSDSAMKFAIKSGKGAIRASCYIVSHAGTFFAEAVSDNPAKAILKIEQKINRQLENWKRRRFLNDAFCKKQVTVKGGQYVR
jgi:ribosome-associated translation inhibitor RaiA